MPTARVKWRPEYTDRRHPAPIIIGTYSSPSDRELDLIGAVAGDGYDDVEVLCSDRLGPQTHRHCAADGVIVDHELRLQMTRLAKSAKAGKWTKTPATAGKR